MKRHLVVCLAAAAALGPRAADACGGTFCDTGPQAMPVDQSGENILFVLDGQTVEAHVQIQYQGSAERFAWVVPMPDVPDVTVGSQPLFTQMLGATVPTYAMQTQNDSCGGGSGGALSFDGGVSGSGGAAGGGGGPQVVFEKTVGAFEVVVLKGGTATEVVDWLQNNNYQNIPSAPQILGDYVVKNYVFVAIKLTAGAGLDEIHPLVFKYTGNEPCVPLKLTRVAATEDMAVRAFFLGDDRVVPENYKHLKLNPVRLNWLSLGQNYKELVSRAADSAVANGKAFVTEYAGSSSVVSSAGVWSSAWNAAPFQGITPEKVADELSKQGLLTCTVGFQCSYGHPLIAGILADYLPVPPGMQDYDFYGCLSCNAAAIDQAKWNAAEFAAALQTRIIDPAVHAKSLLDKWPYLTRLYTTISPAEMTEDPIFRAAPGEPAVPAYALAVQRVTCGGKRGMILPDDRQVALDGTAWPVWDSTMPWAEDIEEYPPSGGKLTLVDNTAKIDALLADWNQKHGWPPPGGSGGSDFGGNGTGGTGAGAGGAGGASASGLQPGGGGGCGVATGSPLAGLSLLGLGLLALGRRRRLG
ncbi:MAG: DUF2330 domain-containing protein [Polyangiaceae bacterium]|nr:DUF2330 domain-containing protein [Polyangiaceae bacterium]MCL4750373.1 DUF2330 domain-containing protein [Myxococcales bacterium]